MAPRLYLLSVPHRVARINQIVPQKRLLVPLQNRFASNDAKKSPSSSQPIEQLNKETNLHVSEEQAEIDKIMNQTPPDIEQGTPVQEILQRDKDAQEKAPEVLKKKFNAKSSNQTRSFSTSTRRRAVEAELVQFEDTRAIGLDYPNAGVGHKFALPDVQSIKRTDHFKHRYDPVVEQVTKSLMKHGKLATAQRNMSIILDTLRSAPPPQPNIAAQGRSLLTDSSRMIKNDQQLPAVPREALPLSPIQYLTAVVDSVAPLIKIRQQRGIAGGGASLPIPVPLGVRQRRRQAIQWILSSADSRREVRFADRVAKEIINVAEGRSSAWEKRALVHRLGISARSNIRLSLMGPRGGRR